MVLFFIINTNVIFINQIILTKYTLPEMRHAKFIVGSKEERKQTSVTVQTNHD